jgi:hypothetical protein
MIKNAGRNGITSIRLTMPLAIRFRQVLEKAAAKLGGIKSGADLTPLGTTDFSSYLIKAQSDNPTSSFFWFRATT